MAAVAVSIAAAALPASAGATTPRPHRVAGAAGAARFWTPARTARALAHDGAGRSPRAPAPSATALTSNIGVADATALGDRMNGRIFAVDPRQGPYSCSGTALTTPSHSIVLTAGHCLVENHSWGNHIVFVPAFDRGKRPFGTFATDSAYVTRQWRYHENNDYDVAALHVQPNAFGALTDVVGSRGFEFDKSRFLPLRIFGYPAGSAGGQTLRECITRGYGSDPLTNPFPGPPTMPSRCNMAAGSSGGSWVAGNGYIDGVTSYGYDGNRNHLFSPYFGAAIAGFLSRLP
jgi:V8-like Glu-specific endopeptidase